MRIFFANCVQLFLHSLVSGFFHIELNWSKGYHSLRPQTWFSFRLFHTYLLVFSMMYHFVITTVPTFVHTKTVILKKNQE